MIRSNSYRTSAIAMLVSIVASQAHAAGNADEGKKYFETQCIACHSAEPDDGGGVQGPSLIGVVGRRAGSDKEFAYTKQLSDSNLVWDGVTLDRFLTAPDALVPGTAMVIAVPAQSDRDNLIAYFKRVAEASKTGALRTISAAPSRMAAAESRSRTPHTR